AAPFLGMLTGALAARFEHYELVFVEDSSSDGTEQEVREFLQNMPQAPPVTMIHMSLKQGLELAMNAGLDMAIGDFVYEFDTMQTPYPAELVAQAYDTCLAGNDIVSVSPTRNRSMAASLFYKLFNSNSQSKYQLHTNVFRLLSRRAINRVNSLSATMPYRKAAYAASGLKMHTLTFSGTATPLQEELRFSRAVDSLALYTGVGYRIALAVSGVMLLLMVASLVYIVVFYLAGGQPIQGWTTTMLLLTGGFFGVFLLLAFVLKYLSLLVDLIFKKQRYLIESVEKIT
ncbi:glycosyltransferase, partial [Ruminococcaceae bacterium OttesenSCG-928-A16]|nr:glycosyltransferase [Ruminococcaceae bacterium OttesenSCG-928-A16]